MTWELVFDSLKKILDGNDAVRVAFIVSCLLCIMVKCMPLFFANGVECLFMSKKDEDKRNVIIGIVFFIILASAHFLFINVEIGGGIIMHFTLGIGWCLLGVYATKKKDNRFKEENRILVWMIIPLIMVSLVNCFVPDKVLKICVLVSVSALQTMGILVSEKLIYKDETQYKIKGEDVYIYGKISDEVFLVGNTKEKNQATEYSTIYIDKLIEKGCKIEKL